MIFLCYEAMDILLFKLLTLSTLYLGKVHCVDEHCKTSILLSVEGAIKKLLFLEKRETLAVITETLMLSQYTLGPEGGAQEFMKVNKNHQRYFFCFLLRPVYFVSCFFFYYR